MYLEMQDQNSAPEALDTFVQCTLANKAVFSSFLEPAAVMQELIARGIRFEVAFGMWEGVPEISYIAQQSVFEDQLREHPMLSGQECVLLVEFDGRAFLEHFTGNVEYIGVVKQTTAPDTTVQAYTFVPSWNMYFVTQSPIH